MSLWQHSAHVLAHLYAHTNELFTSAMLAKYLSIPSPRLSDILNVLATAYIVTRNGNRYCYTGQRIADAFAEFLTSNQAVGKNESIAEHTKTVCYQIQTQHHCAYSRRTSTVISVLAGVKLFYKSKDGWDLCVYPKTLRTITISTPEDYYAKLQSLDGWVFSDFDD